MVALIDKMAFVGAKPWWYGSSPELGIDLGSNPVTAEEMIAAAGMGWTVTPQPLFVGQNGLPVLAEVPGYKALVRQDTGKVLGIKTNRYEPIQNSDAFSFFDAVVGEGQALYHTAGSLGDGEKVWILAKLPESITINGSDVVENYLLLANAHDGSFSFRMFFSPIRVVCNNTLNFALSTNENAKEGRGYRQTHHTGVNTRLNADSARVAIGLASDFLRDFGKEATKMAQKAISADEITGLLQRLFPLPKTLLLSDPKKTTLLLPEPRRDLVAPEFGIIFKKRDAVERLIHHGMGNENPAVAGTRWAALNGVVEFTDYLQGQDGKRTASLLFGNGQNLKQQAFNLLRGSSVGGK
jgi:phage/plasmid-like protein (TIGR03299 family)